MDDIIKVPKISGSKQLKGKQLKDKQFDNTPFVVSEVRKLDCQFGSITLSRNGQWVQVVFTPRVHVRLAAKHTLSSAQLQSCPTIT